MISFKTPYTPEEVDFDGSRLEVLNKHFIKIMEAGEIQSANYCLSRDGKVFANTALGKLSYKVEDDRPVQPDTIQNIASITKLFCAAAIFKLVENGKLRLDQAVGDFIEEFKAPPFDKINIAHLLTHSSGMMADPGCFENKYFVSPWELIDKMKGDNWIEAALASGMRKKPGEEWAYCSFGFAILGEIISRVSGVFAHDYIIENICKPCEMEDTFFELTPETAKRHAVRNEWIEKHINTTLAGEKEDHGIWSKIPGTGGEMHSTAYDLVKFGTMLLNKGTYNGKRILGRKTVEKMTSQQTPVLKDYTWNSGGVDRPYALGPDMRNNLGTLYSMGTFYHEGAGACSLIVDPVEKLVAAWFVPFTTENVWHTHALVNASSIIWSGLK